MKNFKLTLKDRKYYKRCKGRKCKQKMRKWLKHLEGLLQGPDHQEKLEQAFFDMVVFGHTTMAETFGRSSTHSVGIGKNHFYDVKADIELKATSENWDLSEYAIDPKRNKPK